MPGVRNMPLSQLKRQLSELDRDTEIVAYCLGPHCALSPEAVAQLRKLGLGPAGWRTVSPEWKAAGLPVEMGRGWQSRSQHLPTRT